MTTERAHETLRQLAADANRKHHNIDAACRAMVTRLRAEPALMAALVDGIIRQACLEAVYDARHCARTGLKLNVCTRDLEAISAVNGLGPGGFLGRWITPDGRPLASLLGEELDPMIETEYALAGGHRRNGEFYRALRRFVGDGQRVGKVVKDQRAAQLWRKIAGAREPKSVAAVAAG